MRKIILLSSIAILSACASKSKNIDASYVSPLQYKDYSCSQISQELGRVTRRANQVFGQQDSTANTDAIAMGVGMILFWPALFFIDSDDQKEEVAQLKGELDALEEVAIKKNCYDALDELDNMKSPRKSEPEIKESNYN